MSFYYPNNHRDPAQLDEMRRLDEAGICLFCPSYLDHNQQQRVIHATAFWSVTPNAYPYRHTRLHLLLVPRVHVRDLLDLSAEALADFWVVLAWVRDRHRLAYYGLGVRCGDCRYTGGTIEHLHVHLIVGDAEDPDHEPVRLKLSSRPAYSPSAKLVSTSSNVNCSTADGATST